MHSFGRSYEKQTEKGIWCDWKSQIRNHWITSCGVQDFWEKGGGYLWVILKTVCRSILVSCKVHGRQGTSGYQTDRVSDSNLTPALLMDWISRDQPTTSIDNLHPAHIWRGVNENIIMTWEKKVCLNVSLNIRHVSLIIFRNIKRKVPYESIESPIIVHVVQWFVRHDNRKCLWQQVIAIKVT